MAENFDFRALRADEVELRFDRLDNKTNPKAACFLLYKDARCDMRILDEQFGSFGWQREHKELCGKLYCSVSIKADDGTWVTKCDAGSETQVEAAKGEASDAFKRACFSWGIGRELYTAPDIKIPFANDYEREHKNVYGLVVTEMVVVNHTITKLVICDKVGNVRFSWTREGGKVAAPKSPLDYPLPQVAHSTQHRVGSGKPAKPIEVVSPQNARQVPTKSEAIATVKATLPKLTTKEDILSLWALYPLYQMDVEFKQLFTERKHELGIA